jgi:hypothetical protein
MNLAKFGLGPSSEALDLEPLVPEAAFTRADQRRELWDQVKTLSSLSWSSLSSS